MTSSEHWGCCELYVEGGGGLEQLACVVTLEDYVTSSVVGKMKVDNEPR